MELMIPCRAFIPWLPVRPVFAAAHGNLAVTTAALP
jgi:hypothetical protein